MSKNTTGNDTSIFFTSNSRQYSIKKIIRQVLPLLAKKIPKPQLELSIMLTNIANISWEDYITNNEILLSLEQYNTILDMVSKRCDGVPLEYLLAYKEFYGRKFIVKPSVLIPRPETELLVETTIKIIHDNIYDSSTSYIQTPLHILDCGTGSGCIAVSVYMLMQELTKTHVIDWHMSISDIDHNSLEVARENITKLIPEELLRQNPISIYAGNLLDIETTETSNTQHENMLASTPINVIVANLPYVSNNQIKWSNISHEPYTSLVGTTDNIDGTLLIEALFIQAKEKLTHPHILLFEADPIQFDTLSFLAASHGYDYQQSITDIRNFPRIFCCMKR